MSGKLAVLFAAAGGAQALTTRQAGCSFTAHTEGAVSYPVGQLSSGQTRAGSSMTSSVFTINGTAITDSQGRGCWWTPPATVLQCDVGQIPETGFEIGCDGSVSFNGQTTFYECATENADEVNIYLLDDQATNCAEITLTADGCYSTDCSSGSNSESQSATASQPLASASVSYSTAPASVPEYPTGTGAGSTPGYSVPAETQSQPEESTSYAEQPTEVPSQPFISTIYSTSMITITSCPPEVTYCPVECSPDTESVTESEATPTETPAVSTSAVETPSSPPAESTVPAVYPTSYPAQGTETPSSPPSESTVPAVYPTSYPAQGTESVPGYSATPVESSTAELSTKTPTTLSQTTSKPATSEVYSTTPATTLASVTSEGVYVPSPSSVNIPESCPGGVTNAGEFNLPHLIIVTDSTSPDTANGTQYFGDISSTRSTIFNFDIPSSDEGKTCNLVFLFPEKDTLETSTYTFSGSGSLDFSKLSSVATQETSYSNAPSVESDLGQFTVSPGNAYNVSSFSCPAGTAISIEISDVAGGDTSLRFFQDYNPCPLGLFITTS